MDRPQLAFPVQFDASGRYLYVEQDGDEDVAGCVAAILSWPLGTRPLDPEFGVPEEAFLQGGADLEEMREAIAASEPRVHDLDVFHDDEWLTGLIDQVRVTYSHADALPGAGA